MKIPQFEPFIQEADIEAVGEQMRSGWVGTGTRVEEFEGQIARITGADHVVSTTSGTIALLLAMTSLELEPGAIAFPDYTFIAGAHVASFLGHPVNLVDIRAETLCMDPQKLAELEDLCAVIFVNHNAYSGSDVARAREFCDQRGIPMIEDAAQALGIEGAGRTGDVGVFSFSVPKLVTTGQGGALITDDDALATRARRLRDHGENWRATRLHEFLGLNFKFNDVLAAFGLSQLRRLPDLLARRKQILDRYSRSLPIYRYEQESVWSAVYQAQHPTDVIKALADAGIQAVQYYQPVHRNARYADGRAYPVADAIASELVYLPSSLSLEDSEIDRIIQIVETVES